MDAWPERRVVLCLTKDLAGYWRDIPVTTENVADHIQYGITFGPTEVSMCGTGAISYPTPRGNDEYARPGALWTDVVARHAR